MGGVIVEPFLAQAGRRLLWWYRFWRLVETFGLLPVLLVGALALAGFLAYVLWRTRDWYVACERCFPTRQARSNLTEHFDIEKGEPRTAEASRFLAADPATRQVHLRAKVRQRVDGWVHEDAAELDPGVHEVADRLLRGEEDAEAALGALALGQVAGRMAFDGSLARAGEYFLPTLFAAASAGKLPDLAASAAEHLGAPFLAKYTRETEEREPTEAEMLIFRMAFEMTFASLAAELVRMGDQEPA
jgi:hypothetical protein